MTDQNELVDISGLDKAQLLKALHDGTPPQGLGILHAGDDVPVERFQFLIDQQIGHDDPLVAAAIHRPGELRFDYVFGRPLKVDITDDHLDPWLYDRDAGPGRAAEVIADLRRRQR